MDDSGRQLWSIRVHNNQHAIERLLDKARATNGRSTELRWAVDLTSPEPALLLAVLVAADQTVPNDSGTRSGVLHRPNPSSTQRGRT
ncbi:hypothetical protein DK926_02220 [Rhodococcus sp. Eu-32]|nr:hypothetical protein DK926_02220 [Rhodococcus sp. Eu-32]